MSRPIDKEFEDADDTGVLDITGRNLRQFPTVPGDLLDFNYVFEVDLSNNRFDKVPKEINRFKAIVKLNCHHNSIRWLPEELNLLSNLKEIDISRNFLQKFPTELCTLNLYSINLSNNRLMSIPSRIGNLENMQFLDLSCNSLDELPDSLFTLPRLRHLNLHRNNLTYLSDDIYQLSELHYLDVSSNSISRLPITLRLMVPALQQFTAEDNPLEYPPPHLCARGLVHICQYLEKLEKKGSNPLLLASTQRDDSLRRRKDRVQKKISMQRPLSESTPNGKDKGMGLLDEMANLVNKTFGEKDGEKTPTGSFHWSVAQYMAPENQSNLSNQSKEDYREAALRFYRQQEGMKGNVPSSPGSSSLNETSAISPTSPQRRSDENVYRSSTVSGESSRPTVMGRSLSNEKFPRSGSWNSHVRKSSPVLPSKYIAPDRASEEKCQKTKSSSSAAPVLFESKSAIQLSAEGGSGGGSGASSSESTPDRQAKPAPAVAASSPSKKRPPPLNTAKPQSMSPSHSSPHKMKLPESSSHETSV